MICRQLMQPQTVPEALELLKQFEGAARILAGGTDLLIDLKVGRKKVPTLIDISRINGLPGIEAVEGAIRIGARVTHAQVATSDLIRREATVLSEACAAVGSPQIRNMGTLIGNIVNAMPAADGTTALIALGAFVDVIDCEGRKRVVPVSELFRGPGQSVLDSSREFIPVVEFPLPGPGGGSSFQRLARRKALALPTLNTAVSIRLNPERSCFEEVRIVVGPVSPLPFRARSAESILAGSPVEEKRIRRACQAASEEASPRTSLRGGREYRKEMVKVLVERAIKEALDRVSSETNRLRSRPENVGRI